jgi:chemotaxis protein MotB
MATKTQPIIVIKRKGGHAGHHGGSWKVAYADFVTAMMSLFIVLWLMGSSTKVKKAVAGYFNDPKGTGTMLGTTMTGTGKTITAAADDTMQKLKEKLDAEIKAKKELDEDKNGTFYESGSAKLSGSGQQLLALLAGELKTLPNGLLIEGHTDATQYSTDTNYSNWELSADRANSARRLLQQSGVRSDQVTQVRGYADQFLRIKSNPFDPSNRRISLLVKNDNDPVPTVSAKKVVDGAEHLTVPAGKPKEAKGETQPQNAPRAGEAAVTPRPSTADPAPIPAKPSSGAPVAKAGLMDKLKAMLPGAKK